MNLMTLLRHQEPGNDFLKPIQWAFFAPEQSALFVITTGGSQGAA